MELANILGAYRPVPARGCFYEEGLGFPSLIGVYKSVAAESMLNTISIQPSGVKSPVRIAPKPWIHLTAAVALGMAAIFGYDSYSGSVGIVGPQVAIVGNGPNKIIRVPPGGNLQAAIDRAEGGDIVELQAGAVYSGTIDLPNKPLTDFVTIRSSGVGNLPADKRVDPAQRSSMAAIVSGALGHPAVSASNGANHYRFVGIEFTASSATYNYGLVTLGSGESRADKLPHDIEIDRSYFHPYKGGVARRGLALNSANTTVRNSYFEGFGYANEEAQGICGWTGTRDVHIVNNYIEGGAENVMFGGADPDSAELVPTNIEVRGNHLNKPAEWNGRVAVKTLFELKDAKHAQFTGNLLTNNWQGSAFRITVRNQDNHAPFSTIEDVVIRDNIIDGAGDGINILGRDDTYPSQTLKRLTIENNLFLNLTSGNGFEGSGYFIQISGGEDVTIAHNTSFNSGNIVTFYGETPRRFVFRDNITGHGNYGIHGLSDMVSATARSMFRNNLFMNLNRVPPDDYAFPTGNSIVSGIAEIGFSDLSKRDYRLGPNSNFKRKAHDGTDPGADISSVPQR